MAAKVSIENQIQDHLSRKIIAINSDAADAKQETEIPPILIELAGLFYNHKTSSHTSFVVGKIWESELIPACITCLNCDYAKVQGSWQVAADLARFLQTFFSVAIHHATESQLKEMNEELIPSLINNCVLLCRRIQTRYEMIALSVSPQKQMFMSAFKSVIDTLEKLVSRTPFLSRCVVENSYLLKMLFSEEPDSLCLVLDSISRLANYCGREEFAKIPEVTIYALLDEMVYKLSEFESPVPVAAAVTRTLVELTHVYPRAGDAFFTRYKGIRFIITRWTGKGFGQEQQKLLNFLDSQMRHMKEMERFHRAAMIIQKTYRGFKARVKLSELKRSRKQGEAEEKVESEKKELDRRRDLEEKDLKLQMQMMRHRNVRQVQEERLYLTERMRAKEIDKYLQQSEQEAAVRIQSQWRGYKSKQQFNTQRQGMRRLKATITLQRWARRCLAKVDQRRMLRGKKVWSADGISESRRAELQQKIEEFRERLYITPRSRAEDEIQFNKAQDLLRQQIKMSRVRAKADIRRDTLLAKMKVDSQLIRDAPSLDDELTDDVINQYLNPCAPVALSAKNAHLNSLASEKLPWYKKLDSNSQLDFEDTYSIRANIERQIDKIVKY